MWHFDIWENKRCSSIFILKPWSWACLIVLWDLWSRNTHSYKTFANKESLKVKTSHYSLSHAYPLLIISEKLTELFQESFRHLLYFFLQIKFPRLNIICKNALLIIIKKISSGKYLSTWKWSDILWYKLRKYEVQFSPWTYEIRLFSKTYPCLLLSHFRRNWSKYSKKTYDMSILPELNFPCLNIMREKCSYCKEDLLWEKFFSKRYEVQFVLCPLPSRFIWIYAYFAAKFYHTGSWTQQFLFKALHRR